MSNGPDGRQWLLRSEQPAFYSPWGYLRGLVILASSPRCRSSWLRPASQAEALGAVLAGNPHLRGRLVADDRVARTTALEVATGVPANWLSVGSRLMTEPHREIPHIEELLDISTRA